MSIVRSLRLALGGACLLAALLPSIILARDLSEADKAAFRRPDTIAFPADNPHTAEKAALGKMLFFSTRACRGTASRPTSWR